MNVDSLMYCYLFFVFFFILEMDRLHREQLLNLEQNHKQEINELKAEHQAELTKLTVCLYSYH